MTSGRGKDRSELERTNCINATRTDCGTECGQQRVMRPSWRRLGSLALRRVLTNRMREYFTYGSVGGAGGNPGSYPAANGDEPFRSVAIATSVAAHPRRSPFSSGVSEQR